jgi:hypothetical protein
MENSSANNTKRKSSDEQRRLLDENLRGIHHRWIVLSGKGEDEAKSNCVNYPTNCSSEGLAANDDAKSAAGYATAGFIVGGAALLGGILLSATAPSEEPQDVGSLRVDPMVGSNGGGLSVAGRW